MHYIRVAVETAAKLGMVIVLYDEAMYPSGSAHGMVVKENPAWELCLCTYKRKKTFAWFSEIYIKKGQKHRLKKCFCRFLFRAAL